MYGTSSIKFVFLHLLTRTYSIPEKNVEIFNSL